MHRAPSSLYIYYIKGRFSSPINSPSFLGTWEEEGESFLFFSRPESELVERALEEEKLVLQDSFKVDYFEWIGGRFEEIAIGDVRIVPIWESKRLRDGDILLDPSVVFGAGNHPTTYNCLEALNILFSLERIDSVVDMGCGTGILSLFCAKKGASGIFALDLNPLAVKTAWHNIRLNGFEDRILPVRGRAQDFTYLPVDLIIANIHFDVLLQLMEERAFFQKRFFILSGLFPSHIMDIRQRLLNGGARIFGIVGMESGWPTIVGGFTCDKAP